MSARRLGILHGVVGRGFIEGAQRGDVEACLDKDFGRSICQNGHQSDVDDLGREFSDHVYTEQFHVPATEDKLKKAVQVADDLTWRALS